MTASLRWFDVFFLVSVAAQPALAQRYSGPIIDMYVHANEEDAPFFFCIPWIERFPAYAREWPGVMGPSIDIIEEAPFLTTEQKADIFYLNAARFLRLDEATIARHGATVSAE
jgi:hypothetical protein